MSDHQQLIATASIDVAAALAIISSIFGWLPGLLPHIAGVLGVLWYGLQIWESKTVRHWRDRK